MTDATRATRRHARRASTLADKAALRGILRTIWADTLQVPEEGVGDDADFFALGGDSLRTVEALQRIERRLWIDLPDDAVIEAPTPAEMTCLITQLRHAERDRQGASRPERALVCLQPLGAGRPIFAVAGGSGVRMNNLARLARMVDPERPFFALSGHMDRDDLPPERWVEETTAAHLEEVRVVQREGPYLLIGACAGGIMVWEAARQLAHAGQRVAIALLDTPLRAAKWDGDGRRPNSARVRGFAAYRVAPFDGSVTLILSPNWRAHDKVEAWKRFATGSLATVVLPPALPQVHSLTHGQLTVVAGHLRDWIGRAEAEWRAR